MALQLWLSFQTTLFLVAISLPQLVDLHAAQLPTAGAMPYADINWVPEHVRTMAHRLDARHWMDEAASEYNTQGIVVDAKCQDMVGSGYLQRWNSSRVEYCQSAAPADSSMTCLTHPRRPNEAGTLTCVNRNAVFDSESFLKGGPTGKGADGNLPFPLPGTMRMSCTVPSPKPIADAYAERNQMDRAFLLTALRAQAADTAVRAACAAGSTSLLDHPVVMIARWDPTNPWHHIEDVVGGMTYSGLWVGASAVYLSYVFARARFEVVWQSHELTI